jgi:hypothetical protein
MDELVLPGIAANRTAAFVTDCCRAGEGLCADSDVRVKWQLSDETWTEIATNAALGRAIRDCAERRRFSGQAAREAAQTHFVKAPGILNEIMTDEHSNPRHKIEAIKELRQTALGDGKTEAPANADKFIITIDLGAGRVERYEKDITPVKQLPPAAKIKPDNADWGWRER